MGVTEPTTLISRQSLHHELVTLLRDMIMNGELKPGDKINEPSLCNRFGVSRTPLREALKVLAAEGLLVLAPNRGAVVAKISYKEIDELFPIMGMLESLAGELATEKATDLELRLLRSLHESMVDHYRAREWQPYIKLNREIHETLFMIAGNDSLSDLYRSVMVRIHSVRYVARKSEARWAEAVDDHERLMAALEARNKELVGKILRQHLQHKADMVKEALEELVEEPLVEA